ncbi:hypothetical protein TNCT_124051 [Trichonephila clavata]|uniref:Uncharacterized protein n=1 Tax=Trichonephila clavata TaxID=2740835 RepID=A0A8X6IDY8_TRICU|nr:hypothetical protein TNCT_124051 [Trichonephila clavata]
MDAYSTLVDQILKTPVLANKVQDMVRESDHTSLNLVALEWKSQLANYANYQQFQKEARNMFSAGRTSFNGHFRVQNLKNAEKSLKVIVAGVSNVYRPYTKSANKLPLSIILSETLLR